MNKKILFPLLGITLLLVMAGFLRPSYSADGLPYDLDHPKTGSDGAPNPPLCQQAYLNEIHIMHQAWEANENAITSQPIPASDMVDDAFDSVRTYRCWLEYLCRTVQFSGANPAPTSNPNVTAVFGEQALGRIPGCAAPQNLVIPGTRLHYLPQCSNGPGNALTLTDTQGNFNACMKYVDLNFGAPNPGAPSAALLQNLADKSTVYISLEGQLKNVSSSQRSRAVTQKLQDILGKMQAMEQQAQTLKNFLNKLYNLLPCYVDKCD